jgi:imidazole glycerol-phosphate synthase subunit HisF
MLTKRIIPCLDIKDGRAVKGVNFQNIRDAGDPVQLAMHYSQQEADELVFLDISATEEKRKTRVSLVREIAKNINIPFTIGGGINDLNVVGELLQAGADKVSVNSAAVAEPNLIDALSNSFGSQCIVVAIDAKRIGNQWIVHTHGGRKATDKKLFSWAKEVVNRGAGEILFTSMDHDGTKNGFAIDALAKLSNLVDVPIIASGGAGNSAHFAEAFILGKADAALAASIFHFGEISVGQLKAELRSKGINVRTNE